MARVPISIQKYKTEQYDKSEIVKYLFIIENGKKSWDLTCQCTRDELIKFKDQIEKVLAETSTADVSVPKKQTV